MIQFDKEDTSKLFELPICELRIVLLVYSKVAVEFSEIENTFRLKGVKLRKRLNTIKYFVDTYFSATTGSIAVISKAVSTKYLKCSGCHHVQLKAGAYKCCFPLHDRLSCNAARKGYLLIEELKKKGFKKSSGMSIDKRETENANPEDKLVADWNSKDFARLLLKLYKPYDHLLGGKTSELTKRFTKLKKIFVIEFAEESDDIGWKYYLKKYLLWYFTQIKDSEKNPSMFAMCNMDNLKRFISEVQDAHYCSKHGLFCPYINRCKKVGCNSQLRDRIRERYN